MDYPVRGTWESVSVGQSGEGTVVLIGGLSLLRPLLATGADIQVVPHTGSDPVKYSRWFRDAGFTVRDFAGDGEGLCRQLVALARRTSGRPALFFGSDEELTVINDYRDLLGEHYRFQMPPSDVVRACTHKRGFAALAERHQLPIPCSVVSRSNLSADEIVESVGLPCVFKPDSHVGWHASRVTRALVKGPAKVLVARTLDECVRMMEVVERFSDQYVVQRFIPGDEDQIYSYHTYVTKRGDIPADFVGKKIRTYPADVGESSFLTLIDNQELTTLGREIVEALSIRGPVKIDFKRDAVTGKFFVLEVNLRFNLWHHLGARCGVNLPHIAYLDNCNHEIVPGAPYCRLDYRKDVRWMDFELDFIGFLREFRPRRQLTWGQYLQSLWCKKVYRLFSWDDPLPFVVSTSRVAGRMVWSAARGLFGQVRRPWSMP